VNCEQNEIRGFNEMRLVAKFCLFVILLAILKRLRQIFFKPKSQPQIWDKNVLPHGPIEKLGEGIFRVEGVLPHGPLPRAMVIYQLVQGGLLIHSPIALNEDAMHQVEILGKPRVCIVPNAHHRLDGGVWKARFPDLLLLCPRACRVSVEEKYKVDGTVEDYLKFDGVNIHLPPNGGRELVYELTFRDGSNKKALVCADLWFNVTRPLPGFAGKILRTLGSVGRFGVTKIGMVFVVLFGQRSATAAFMRQLAELSGLSLIIPCHGTPVTTGCRDALLEAAGRVAPPPK